MESPLSRDAKSPAPLISNRDRASKIATRKEIWAWWLYMAAIEPISVAVLQLFMPLLLEALSSMVGYVAGSSPKIPCPDPSSENCILFELGGWLVRGSTFSYIILAISVALQAIVFICFGALADYGKRRRKFLAASTILGSLFCVGALGVHGPGAAYISGSLNILVTISFGLSLMLYNSYLPLLAENHPDTLGFQSDDPIEVLRRRETVANDLSTKSFMLGYLAAVLVLAICAVYVHFASPGLAGVRYCIAACGVIWLVGSIYPLKTLKSRPGPDLPVDANYATFSIKKTWKTLSKRSRLPNLFWFLLAYFMFADGCNTIGVVAVLVARNVLQVAYSTMIICAILAPFCGVAGNFFFFFMQKRLRLTSKTTLLFILVLLASLTIYIGSGVYFTSFGLRRQWELYLVACVYGFLMGAMQSFSRVIYGEMIPPGEEAEFFSLYAITDKGSSWIGPVIQAIVANCFSNQRWGMFFLAALILLPFPLLIWCVDPIRGREEGQNFFQFKPSMTTSKE